MNSSICSTPSILDGFLRNSSGDLLKTFLANGDESDNIPSVPYSCSSTPMSASTSSTSSNNLFPAHFVIGNNKNNDEWLIDNVKYGNVILASKENIMAPVLKSTSADYWLAEGKTTDNGETKRPSVAERVPDPFLSLWLANPSALSAESSFSTDPESGERSPKKARINLDSANFKWLAGQGGSSSRIQWPEYVVDWRLDDWIVDGRSSPSSNAVKTGVLNLHQWLVVDSSSNETGDKLDVNNWLSHNTEASNGSVDAWLTSAMNDFTLTDDENGDDEIATSSSIEVLEAAEYESSVCVQDEVDSTVETELTKWLIIN